MQAQAVSPGFYLNLHINNRIRASQGFRCHESKKEIILTDDFFFPDS